MDKQANYYVNIKVICMFIRIYTTLYYKRKFSSVLIEFNEAFNGNDSSSGSGSNSFYTLFTLFEL